MSVSTKSVSAESASARSSSAMALLDDLERRWVLTQAELAQLREENAELKQQLAQVQGSTAPETQASDVKHPTVEPTEPDGLDGSDEDERDKPELESQAASSVDASSQEDSKPEPPSPHALLAQWYKRYPQAFFKGHTQPLKVGIHHDLAEREPWSGKLIRRALANYVNLPRYIKSVREGTTRIDLEGNEAGVVDAEAAQHAADKRAKQTSPSPSERSPAAKTDRLPRVKTVKSKKKTLSEARRGVEKTPLEADAPQKHLSLEDKLLGLQQKFKSD
ncbi:MAG: ProQ/FinO family protein [Halomonas sp.]|nr:ProQ/FinO family protein [Halomonas sp.]